MSTSLRNKAVALVLVHCFVLTTLAAPRSRPRAAGSRVARIVFEPNDPVVRPGKSTVVKASVVDQKNNPIKGAKIAWTVPKEAEGLFSVSKPLDGAADTIVIVGLSGGSTATDVKVSASSGRISGDLVLRYVTEPVDVDFVHDSIDLAPGTKQTIVAKVSDATGNLIHGLDVSWKLADKKFEDLVFLGSPTNTDTINSIDVVWLGKTGQKPTEIPIIASVGPASGVATINYQPEAKGNGLELVFSEADKDINAVTISPTEAKKIKVRVTGDNGAVLPKAEINCELSDDDRDFVTISTKTKGEISLTGLGGDMDSTPRTILLPCSADGTHAVLAVQYEPGTFDIDWTVLPSSVTGDNYGRTLRMDYYCIDVTIHNKSGADFAVSRLRFVNAARDFSIPVANYKTVHGSIARRKLTHPRTMTLAIVDGLGTLMTGFNPFFHEATHAKNYSQFIDILSNPLKNGLEKAWQDPFPDEFSRFEENVLRNETILAKDKDLVTTVFIPKRSLPLTDAERKFRDDPVFVKRKLGQLEVLGYQFKRVSDRSFRSKN